MVYINGIECKATTKQVELFMDCLANSTNHIITNEDLTVETPIICTIASQLDIPRNVLITVTDEDTSISAFDIDVLGVNAEGDIITENFVFAGGLVQVGNIAFGTITSVVVNSIIGDNEGDVLNVGIGSKIGLSNTISLSGDVYKITLGTTNLDLADYTVNVTYNTVDLSVGAPIGAYSDYTIWYKTS